MKKSATLKATKTPLIDGEKFTRGPVIRSYEEEIKCGSVHILTVMNEYSDGFVEMLTFDMRKKK
jgi:hypothetical protein